MANNEKDLPGYGNPEEKRILIVDDDESVWDLLYYIVRKEGFMVEKASDGEEALSKAKILHPALILLDLMLPRLSGAELLTKLRLDPKGKSVKVIALTNLAEQEEKNKIMSLGALEYLIKAMQTPEEVVQKVKAHLS